MYHQYDFIDGFRVLFGNKQVILPKCPLPLGMVSVEMLDVDDLLLNEIELASEEMISEITASFSGEHDPTQAGLANQAMEKFFSLLVKLPLYKELEMKDKPSISLLHEHPELRERYRNHGMEEYKAYHAWQDRVRSLIPSIRVFREKTEFMLKNNFSAVKERSASGYAQCLTDYYKSVDLIYHLESDALEAEGLEGMDYEYDRQGRKKELERLLFPTHFPMDVTFKSIPDPKKKGKYMLAEEVFFTDVCAFLSIDLIRGLAVGHLPRRCEHCGRWFLLEGGYDTRYCENPAPGEPDKTCRQVGAHRKETRLNGTDEIRAEYARVANRLKGQKFHKTISVSEWNDYMRLVQDLRDDAVSGKITVAELKKKYDGISVRRRRDT